jgi:serine/threonine protein kinase
MNTISNYTIKSELGQGGMASVYLAEHITLGLPVALKILAKEFAHNENIRKRFLAEARNMFKMSHPNIIKVTDLIEEGDTVAFVMEYVDGETLKEYLERKGKLSDEEIKTIFSQMLDAVGYVHKQGLIHRDIKPSNFMISPKGQVKLLDFGIAKNTDTSSAEYTQTGTGVQMGTLMYMSPEQVNETKSVTAQSDIYSLGVVLWQMVVGQKPYDTKTLSTFQLQSKIVNENLALTNTNWDASIQKATHKNIDSRYTSAQHFFNDLQNPTAAKVDKTAFEKNDDKTIFENKVEATIIENKKSQTITPKEEKAQPTSNATASNNIEKEKKKPIGLIIGLIAVVVLLIVILISKSNGPAGKLPTTKITSATVRVNLTYASEYIPEMYVTLLNIDTKEKMVQRSTMNIDFVKFNNVPVGEYVVYAVTVENLVNQEMGLGMPDYNAPLVPARGGYTARADEWSLLTFMVEANSTLSVDINDWDVNIP